MENALAGSPARMARKGAQPLPDAQPEWAEFPSSGILLEGRYLTKLDITCYI